MYFCGFFVIFVLQETIFCELVEYLEFCESDIHYICPFSRMLRSSIDLRSVVIVNIVLYGVVALRCSIVFTRTRKKNYVAYFKFICFNLAFLVNILFLQVSSNLLWVPTVLQKNVVLWDSFSKGTRKLCFLNVLFVSHCKCSSYMETFRFMWVCKIFIKIHYYFCFFVF